MSYETLFWADIIGVWSAEMRGIRHTRGYYGLYAWLGNAMKSDLSNQGFVALVSIDPFCCCYL